MNVSATATLIDTDSSAVSAEISTTQVSDMPIPSRNFLALVGLTAGVVSDANGGIYSSQTGFRTALSGGAAFVDGSRSSSNAYLIDGMDNNDPGFQTPTISVPIDAIGDMRVLTQTYSAEYGGSAVQINVATKSGTNKFHGTAYDFFQNDDLDATDQSFGNPAIKPVQRYNQFGESFGGPVWIPRIFNGRDKLFFFTNYEGLRQSGKSTQFGLYPTTAEIGGDFSADAPIYNPATGLQFTGNKIPTIDPVAAKIIAYNLFVTPNIPLTSSGVNAQAVLTVPNTVDQWSVRGDYKITPKDSIFARYSESTQNVLAPSISPLNGLVHEQLGKNVGISYVRIISPNLVEEVRVGFNRPISIAAAQGGGTDIAGSLFSGTSPASAVFGPPLFNFTQNYTSIGGNANAPLDYITTSYSLADNLTIIKGAHTIEVGAGGRHMFFKEINAYEPRGLLSFNGEYTAGPGNVNGNPIADFLLGLSNSASINQGNYTGWYNSIGYDFFGQDNWRVNRKLTVNLGIRYEYFAPLQEEYNRISIFNPAGDNLLTPDAAIVSQLNSPLIGLDPSSYMFDPDHKNFAPRVGFSYRPFGKTVVRAGYGIFYDTTEFNEYVFPVLNAPFSKSFGATGTVPSPVSMDKLFPVSATPEPAPGIGCLTLNKNSRTPYVEEWNLAIEYELPRNSVLEIGYTGSEGARLNYRHWLTQGVLSNPGPNATVKHLYPNFGYILEDRTGASASYNSLRVRFEKKFDKGYSFLAHYTYSHALGTSSSINTYPQDTWNQRGDYGSLNFDETHNLGLSGMWELPFGKGRTLMNNLPYAANLLVSGWQFNGIYQATSGPPYAIGAPFDNSGTGTTNPRAKQVGNPHGQDSVHPGRAFNTQAFVEPDPGTFGNSSVSALRGKGINNVDFSMFKNNYIRESLNFQLRVEAFNVFNHTQPGPYPNTGLTSPGVGLYNSLNHEARVVQLAAKIIF